jgi:excisionase family DNA binding protein
MSIVNYTHGGSRVAREKSYSTAEAAKKAGISKATLLRWIREKKVADVRRDRNEWRVFTEADIQRIKKVVSS